MGYYTNDKRLVIYADAYAENSFVLMFKGKVFARINKCGRWHIWYYTKHLQKDYDKLRDAIIAVNEEFKKTVKQ